jgi:hypothetical protein
MQVAGRNGDGRAGWRRRGGTLLAAIVLFVAAPMMAAARAAAQPISLGEWMSAIFASAHRKIDPSEKGLVAGPPPAPPPLVQSTSEPAPPRAPAAEMPVPRLWGLRPARTKGRPGRGRRRR